MDRLRGRGIDPTPGAMFEVPRDRRWSYQAIGNVGDTTFAHEVRILENGTRISLSIQTSFTAALVAALCLALERRPQNPSDCAANSVVVARNILL